MCSTAFVLHHNNLVDKNIKIKTKRARLKAFIKKDIVSLKGPAEIVYESSLKI